MTHVLTTVTSANMSSSLTSPYQPHLSHPSLLVMVTTKPELNVFIWERVVRKRTVMITQLLRHQDGLPCKLSWGKHSALTWDPKITQKQEHAGIKMATGFLEKWGLKIFDVRCSSILPPLKFSFFLQIAHRSGSQEVEFVGMCYCHMAALTQALQRIPPLMRA